MRKRALGKMHKFFEYTIEEKYSSEEEEEEEEGNNPAKSSQENIDLNNINSTVDDLSDSDVPAKRTKTFHKLVLNSSPDSDCSEDTDDLVTWIMSKARPVLVGITRGTTASRRHKAFHNGSQTEKNKLRWDSGFGSLDEECGEEVFNLLLTWFRQDFDTSTYNSIQYVSDVWFPEAIIRALVETKNMSYEKAENEYLR